MTYIKLSVMKISKIIFHEKVSLCVYMNVVGKLALPSIVTSLNDSVIGGKIDRQWGKHTKCNCLEGPSSPSK